MEVYREKYSLYSPDLGPQVDRLYRSQLAAPFGTQLAERVGEIPDPDSEDVREGIIEEPLYYSFIILSILSVFVSVALFRYIASGQD